MRRLMLLRHAKSNWPAGVADRDRPLAARGREAAPVMGRYLADEMLLPDLVLISPAKRTVETWELVLSMLPEKPATQYEPRIYEAKPGALLYVVQETEPSVKTLLMIGHNPGFENLVALLTEGASDSGRGIPPAGVVWLGVPAGSAIDPGTAAVHHFWWP